MERARDHALAGSAETEVVGKDLGELAAGVGVRLIDVQCLTRLPSAVIERSCFCFRFEGDLVLKGRLFANEADARRVGSLLERMDPRHFPRVVAHCGRALLIEWRTGRLLTEDSFTAKLVEACGSLLAAIHRVEAPEMTATVRPVDRLKEEVQLAEDLARLVTPGGLTESEAAQLTALAAAAIPGEFESGPVHLDFCPENLLLGHDGRVVVIDNESLSFDAFDYALARTWYRWPMSTKQRRAFLEGYRARSSPEAFLAHKPYWMTRAVLASALFRIDNDTTGKGVPMRALRRLLADSAGTSEPAPGRSE